MKYKIILTFFIVALLASLVMVSEGIPSVCELGKGCDAVKTSKYAKTFNIFNAYYGVVIFTIMSLLVYSHIYSPTKLKKQFIVISSILGSLIALRFLYLQAFVLHAYCTYCIIVDVSTIMTFIILFTMKDEPRKYP